MVTIPRGSTSPFFTQGADNNPEIQKRIIKQREAQIQENIELSKRREQERKEAGLDRAGYMGADWIEKDKLDFKLRELKRKEDKIFHDTNTSHIMGL